MTTKKLTKEEQEYVREKVEDALGYSLELYGIKEMARDSGLSKREVDFAEAHICFYAKIEE